MAARGIPLSDTRTLHVTARLQSGVVLPTRFPAPLDGIIAAHVRRDRLDGRYFDTPETPDRETLDRDGHGRSSARAYRDRYRHWPLPLHRLCPRGVSGSQWVWAATCATPISDAGIDLRYIHKRFDALDAETRVDRLPASTDTGTTKAERIPIPATVCTALEWWCLGDRDGIARILADVAQLGAQTASGEGFVLDWTVVDVGVADLSAIQWTPGGHIARPYHPGYAAWLGLDAPDVVRVEASRPPYWRAPQTGSDHGGFVRTGREVIAPWTQRPHVSTPD